MVRKILYDLEIERMRQKLIEYIINMFVKSASELARSQIKFYQVGMLKFEEIDLTEVEELRDRADKLADEISAADQQTIEEVYNAIFYKY